MALAQVVDADFETKVLANPKPVLVEFWATWCAPCRAVAPVVERVAAQVAGEVDVVKVDVDQAQQTAQRYRITSIPTLAVFVGGKLTAQVQGAVPEPQLLALLDKGIPGRGVPGMAPAQLEAAMGVGSVLVVDVRPAADFGRHTLPGAVNAPLDPQAPEAWTPPQTATPQQTLVLVDKNGSAAEPLGRRLLKAQPGVRVAFLKGGVLEWEVSGRRLT